MYRSVELADMRDGERQMSEGRTISVTLTYQLVKVAASAFAERTTPGILNWWTQCERSDR